MQRRYAGMVFAIVGDMFSSILRSAAQLFSSPEPVAAQAAAKPAAGSAPAPSAPAASPASSPSDSFSTGGSSASGALRSAPSAPAAAPTDPGLFEQLSEALSRARSASPSALVGGRNDGPLSAEAAAAELYRSKGNNVYDLRKEQDVLNLVRNSPQIDAGTGADPNNDGVSRCATAATTNALLLSKSPQASAEAVRKTAAEYGLTPTADQTAAIEAMKSGRMSPNQAAQVQELLYDSVRANGRQAAGGRQGMTGNDLLDLNATLKKNGAFEGATVDLKLQSVTDADGNAVGHWTVEVQMDNLMRTAVDSWPGRDGRSRVRHSLANSPNASSLSEGTRTQRNLLGEVSLRPFERDNGTVDTQYLRRELTAPGSNTVQEWSWDTILPGSIPRTRVPPDRSYAL